MSRLALSRFRALSITFLLVAMLALVSLPTHGQNQAQDPPLYRTDVQSNIQGQQPIHVLTDPSVAYVRGDEAVPFAFNYKCVSSTGNPGSSDGGLLDPCTLGSGAAGSPRQVTVFYNITGGNPQTGSDQLQFDLSSDGAINTQPWDVDFTGNHDFSTEDVVEGQTLRFFVRVPVDPSDDNPGVCNNAPQGEQMNCFDPADTTGQSMYVAKFDSSTPRLLVSDPANANVFNLTENEWFLYTNQNLSNKLPDIVITVADNPLGSPIDEDETEILRDGSDNTTNFDKTVVGNGQSIIYAYDYSTGSVSGFDDNTTTRFDVVFSDVVGHRVDTQGSDNPGLLVVTDITTPELDEEASRLSKRDSQDGLASLGENLGVSINATDVGADFDTPPEFLDVTVQLVTGDNDTVKSPVYTIPWNETEGSYVSEQVTVPSNWVTGVTSALATVTDGAENSVTKRINGTVSVDVDLPDIDPIAPLNGTIAEDFVGLSTVTFRVRAADPGDTDEWNGASTTDTDKLGIDLNGVRVHFKVGDGPFNSVRLSPQSAVNTFSGTRTFNAEDEIFYYLSAKDLAGNTRTYPETSDPHVSLFNVTENDGRVLRLQVDQLGPEIDPARELAFIGSDHEFIFDIEDTGIGVDTNSGRFFWRLAGGGSFREIGLTQERLEIENATGVLIERDVYRATIPTQEEGATIEWYVTARDKLDNTGSLGSNSAPQSSEVDVTPPEVTVTAPDTATTSRFNVTWTGTDPISGIKDYTLQFRVQPGNWFTVPSRELTTETSYEVCAATDQTYDFRIQARDRAGNVRAFPDVADASTFVDAPLSCAQPPEVRLSSPGTGDTLSGTATILYSAASTSFPDNLDIRVEVGQGATLQSLFTSLPNTGTATWDTTAPEQDDVCFPDGTYTVRVVARDPNGLEGNAESTGVTLNNGITSCRDRDGDGLSDEWEFANFGNLDQGTNGDPDNDGFTNQQELLAGTDPTDATSTPSGGGGGSGTGGTGEDDDNEWDPLYLLVVLAFVAVLAVFVVGMARRW